MERDLGSKERMSCSGGAGDHGCFCYYYCKTVFPVPLRPVTSTTHSRPLEVSVGQEPKKGFVGQFWLGAPPCSRQLVARATVARGWMRRVGAGQVPVSSRNLWPLRELPPGWVVSLWLNTWHRTQGFSSSI